MYSVLLVDDEKIIREGVYELLSMADLDLDLAMAASAVEAISVLEERKIDLVIGGHLYASDDGLDLFDVIRERWPHCKVIFLTGYSEFDYVYKVHSMPAMYSRQRRTGSFLRRSVTPSVK